MRLVAIALLASCSADTPPPPPPAPPPPSPAPAPVAMPPKPGEAMELLALTCPRALGSPAATIESALRRRGHAITQCFDKSTAATIELGAEGVRSIAAPTPTLETCIGHALRRIQIPDGLVGATCTIDYQLTR
jgi:hypothetical protein